jgi:ATP diphosphatase
LRRANRKFESRFREMEQMAGPGFAGLDLEAKEAFWRQAKERERNR